MSYINIAECFNAFEKYLKNIILYFNHNFNLIFNI